MKEALSKGGQDINEDMVIVVGGLAKLFVGEICDLCKD
jgi:hypothetical protein